jgi:hypothetical protein
MAKFLANKEWICIAYHEKCGQNKPANTKTSTKTVNKRGGKTRGRGRGNKFIFPVKVFNMSK